MERPKLGATVSCTDRLIRTRPYKNGRYMKSWVRYAEFLRKAKPIINGTYVGYRTAQDGYSSYCEEYTEWTCTGRKEVWLVVVDPRHNPIRVLPEDTTVIPV